MTIENEDYFVQLINTAVVKTIEQKINGSYEERLSKACATPAMKALSLAITNLSEREKISYDQAAIKIVEIVRELDSIWGDYIKMEGLEKLRGFLRKDSH